MSLARRTPLRRKGKKTLAWDSTRRKLKPLFEAASITRCEVCGTDDGLGFAHSLPRRDIKTKEDMEEVALLCFPDHGAIDDKGHEFQFDTIRYIIANRETPVAPIS
jgi:hypothetical protein